MDVICVAYLELFGVTIREFWDFEPTSWGINKGHTGEVKINFFDFPPWLILLKINCIWTYKVYMYCIQRYNLIFSYLLGRQLTVARGTLILDLRLFKMLVKLPWLVCNNFPVEYLFESIG